jgi:hypothetical protein
MPGMGMVSTAAVAIGLVSLAIYPLCGEQAQVPAAGHETRVKKQGDTLEVVATKESTQLVIVSGSGIGGATAQLAAEDFGRPLVLEFKYADGRGFKMLEHLSVTTPRMKIYGQLDESGRLAFSWADAQGKFPGELEMSGFVRVQVERLESGMRVVFPANMLDRAARLEIEWIDAYR